MTELIACLSSGKGTWSEVYALLRAQEWDAAFILTDSFGKERFNGNAELILIDENFPAFQLARSILEQLQPKIKGTEVALNFASGSGKLHMALLSATLKLGVGIRIVTMGDRGLVSL